MPLHQIDYGITKSASVVGGLIPLGAGIAGTGGGGANALLIGETQGFAIDATSGSIRNAAYTGGPSGGFVSVIDTGTPGNNLSNVALDNSNLVNTGTSPKQVFWNSSPYLRWTPHNLLSNPSEDFSSNTEWSSGTSIAANSATAPDGTSTASVQTTNGANGIASTGAITTLASTVYTASLYLKSSNQQWAFVQFRSRAGADRVRGWFDLTNGVLGSTGTAGSGAVISSSITSVGSGWYRCTVTGTLSATDGALGYGPCTADAVITLSTGTSVSLWGALLVRGYNANPYLKVTSAARIGIPQGYDTLKSQHGLLLEPSATNLALRSQDFSATWAQTDTTRTSTNNSAPDSSSTATLMTEGSAGTATNKQAITITANATYTISVFLKKGNTNFIRLGLYETATTTNRIDNWFNLNTGAMGTPANGGTGTGATGTITSVDGSWYRCTLTGAVGNAATAVTLDMSSASADGSATRVNSATYQVWGAQAETLNIATSYIQTLGATVTRAADIVSAAVTTYPHSATAGTFFGWVRFGTIADNVGYRFCQIDDGSTNEVVQAIINTNANPDDFSIAITDNGVNQVDNTVTHTGTLQTTTANKLAMFYTANDSGVLADGGTEVKDTSCTMPTVTQYRIGGNFSGSGAAKGYIYQITYLPRRMTQAQMQTKTT